MNIAWNVSFPGTQYHGTVTFLGSQDYGTGFCQPRVHTVMAGQVP